jgi:hypothetical protein
MLIPALLVLPVAFVVFEIIHLRKGNRMAAGIGVLCFALALATGAWSILQSRSSTAGIGFLFLPLMASGAGLLGLGFGVVRESAATSATTLAWLFAAVAAIAIVMPVVGGVQTVRRNASRDRDYAVAEKQIAQNRASIATMLAQNKGAERETIGEQIRARMNDRTFLIPALESEFVSPGLLDTLAVSPDLGVALQAMRNPNTSAATIERIHRTHASPDYFAAAIAAHPNAPPALLREIYKQPGLEIWFAGNPATPTDMLDEIATTTKSRSVLQALAKNSSLSSTARRRVEAALAFP